MKQLLNEPLVHFLAIGALLFGLFGLAPQPAGDETKRILVGADDAQRLSGGSYAPGCVRRPGRSSMG